MLEVVSWTLKDHDKHLQISERVIHVFILQQHWLSFRTENKSPNTLGPRRGENLFVPERLFSDCYTCICNGQISVAFKCHCTNEAICATQYIRFRITVCQGCYDAHNNSWFSLRTYNMSHSTHINVWVGGEERVQQIVKFKHVLTCLHL